MCGYAGEIYAEVGCHVFQVKGWLQSFQYPIFEWYCKEWAVGFGARTLSMCPHLGHVTVFVCVVCAVKVERVSASFLVVLLCFDVDVSGCRVCVRVYVGVLCGN